MGLLLSGAGSAGAGTVLSPWTPVFKGVDYAAGTNTPGGGGMPDLQVVYTMRVDLTDTDIRLFASPRTAKGTLLDKYNYLAGSYDTAGYKTSSFLRNHGLQVAINANNFHDPGTPDTESPDYGEAEGSPFVVDGVLINQGVSVTVQNPGNEVAAFFFTTNNQPTFIPTNWPAHSTATAYTAVTGLYTILANGVNVGSNYISQQGAFPHGVNPRTLFGLSPGSALSLPDDHQRPAARLQRWGFGLGRGRLVAPGRRLGRGQHGWRRFDVHGHGQFRRRGHPIEPR